MYITQVSYRFCLLGKCLNSNRQLSNHIGLRMKKSTHTHTTPATTPNDEHIAYAREIARKRNERRKKKRFEID